MSQMEIGQGSDDDDAFYDQLNNIDQGFKKFWFDYGGEPSGMDEIYEAIEEAHRILKVMEEIERSSEVEVRKSFYCEPSNGEIFDCPASMSVEGNSIELTGEWKPIREREQPDEYIYDSCEEHEEDDLDLALYGALKVWDYAKKRTREEEEIRLEGSRPSEAEIPRSQTVGIEEPQPVRDESDSLPVNTTVLPKKNQTTPPISHGINLTKRKKHLTLWCKPTTMTKAKTYQHDRTANQRVPPGKKPPRIRSLNTHTLGNRKTQQYTLIQVKQRESWTSWKKLNVVVRKR